MKNISAIEKIISELAMKDYLACNPVNKDGTRKYKKHRPYSLSEETNEAREISEEEYKGRCLRYNLTHSN